MSWPLGKVSDLGEVISGYAFKSEWFGSGSSKVIRIGDLQNGQIQVESAKTIDNEIHKIRVNFKIKSGDILMALSGATVGKIAIADSSIDGAYLNQRVAIIRGNSAESAEYLKYVFTGSPLQKLLSNAGGAAQPNLSPKDLAEMEIPLPPLAEQKRIAAILDKADAIRRKRQQAIQLADDFLRAVFLDMFGDPVTNPTGCKVKSISECLVEKIILQVQDGNHGNDHPKVNDFSKTGIPFVTANVVRQGNILFDQCYYLEKEWLEKLRIGFAKPRDVLISHKGSLGFTAVLDNSFDTYIFSPQTTYYRLDEEKLIPEYLKAYFDSLFFQRLFAKEGIQSTRAYLGITRQKELPVLLPSIESQREFVAISKQFKKVKENVFNSKAELVGCFNSLSQKAFSGQL